MMKTLTLGLLLFAVYYAVRRFLCSDRPLQLAEISSAVSQALAVRSIRGISTRYFPTHLQVIVSDQDYRMWQVRELQDALYQVVKREGQDPEWTQLEPSFDLSIRPDSSLTLGAAPRCRLGYPPGEEHATWTPEHSLGAGVEGSEALLDLVMVSAASAGTAIEERVQLFLGPRLPLALVLPAASGFLEVSDTKSIVTSIGLSWDTPPPIKCRALGVSGDRPVFRLTGRKNQPPLLWCPSGTAILGSDPTCAHVVPSQPPPELATEHIEISLAVGHRFQLADLTNPGLDTPRAESSSSATIGQDQSFVLEVRALVIDPPQNRANRP